MSLIAQILGADDPAENTFAMSPADRSVLGENDAANAARLLAVYGHDMIFVGGKGWGIWDGNRFSFNDSAHKARAMAAKLPAIVEEEIGACWQVEIDAKAIRNRRMSKPLKYKDKDDHEIEEEIRKERAGNLRKHATKLGNIDKRKKALEDAEWQVLKPITDLDADPWAFVVQNGVLNLRAVHASPAKPKNAADLAAWRGGWLTAPRRDFLPTKCAGATFVAGAVCPEWEGFIELILPDPDVRACFQRCMGALIFGMNTAQVCLMLRGSGGNGKSTLMQIIGHVMGVTGNGYAAPCKVEMFLVTQNQNASQATPEEVDLPGSRAMLASEPAPTDILSAKKIKALTGGDPRTARALNMPQFVYRPSAIPVIQFNRTPKIKDEDEGTRRRLVFIPLDVNLRELPPEKKKDPMRVEAALKEELPGILNWMLDGFRDFQTRLEAGQGTPPGIDPPQVMQDLKDKLLESADPVGEFLKDCCTTDPKGRIKTTEFFRAFEAWARDSGARPYTAATVRELMQEKGFGKRKSDGQQVFPGLTWNKDNREVEGYLRGVDRSADPDAAPVAEQALPPDIGDFG